MTTYMDLKIDGDIDLNSLFNLTYNFDLLKSILDVLLKQHKSMTSKLNNIEDKLESKDKKIIEYL